MKIIMTSDLHISRKSDMSEIKSLTDCIVEFLVDHVKQNEDITLLICGDIIDRGDKEAFSNLLPYIGGIYTIFASNCVK